MKKSFFHFGFFDISHHFGSMYQFMINLHTYNWPIEDKTQLLLQMKREEIHMLNTKNEIILENDFGLVCAY